MEFRTFSGDLFRAVPTDYPNKREAQAAAKKLRNDGYLARITKRVSRNKMVGGGLYVVWYSARARR